MPQKGVTCKDHKLFKWAKAQPADYKKICWDFSSTSATSHSQKAAIAPRCTPWGSAGSAVFISTADRQVHRHHHLITESYHVCVSVLSISPALCSEGQEQQDTEVFLDMWAAWTQWTDFKSCSWKMRFHVSSAEMWVPWDLSRNALSPFVLLHSWSTALGVTEASVVGEGQGRHQFVYFYFLSGIFAMDDRGDSLMTVHLLANSGHSLLLQQTLDRLLEWICPDVRLFLVSERVTPLKYYERYRKRSCGFPGISVLLFLHESLGEERIFQVHEQFQRPPWCYQCAQIANGQSHPGVPAHQDFYSLDDQMPVWGIRRVHCGPEILRVTLYCSFDNYEDAVRLYETILQKEATMQKSNFCVFVLYETQNMAMQLCLKQLPIGVAAELKESSALQFKVQEMGQLVPLLPNPCVPISDTRWQTQDYEGNIILLQVCCLFWLFVFVVCFGCFFLPRKAALVQSGNLLVHVFFWICECNNWYLPVLWCCW